jgi:hypothetical protein
LKIIDSATSISTGCAGIPKQDHVPAVPDDPERVRDRGRRARHLEDHVCAFAFVAVVEPARNVVGLVDVDDIGRLHPPRELDPELPAVRREHTPGGGRPGDRDAEQSDRAAAEDRSRLSGEVDLARREDRVARRAPGASRSQAGSACDR